MTYTFRLHVKYADIENSRVWTEDYTHESRQKMTDMNRKRERKIFLTSDQVKDPQIFGEYVIGFFNDTLRPGESPRELVKVEKVEEVEENDEETT